MKGSNKGIEQSGKDCPNASFGNSVTSQAILRVLGNKSFNKVAQIFAYFWAILKSHQCLSTICCGSLLGDFLKNLGYFLFQHLVTLFVTQILMLPQRQCDQSGQFLIGLGDKFCSRSPNILSHFLIKTAVSVFGKFLKRLSSFIIVSNSIKSCW